ncbi:hypothetical protein FHS70_003491 [Flammeovirga yaeyamensis]|nr:hypothetical protein [Flammeovirga yaeyamensis]
MEKAIKYLRALYVVFENGKESELKLYKKNILSTLVFNLSIQLSLIRIVRK